MTRQRGGDTGRPTGDSAAPPDGGGDDRAQILLTAVAVAAVGVLLLLLFTTVFSLYKGTRAGYLSPSEKPAVAQVGDCRRLGPVSVDGFGYWWECQVAVRTSDGRTVHTVVDRSIVTPADAGRDVEFRQACKHGTTGCSYGRPTGRGTKTAVGALILVQGCVLLFCGFAVVMLLVRGVLGRRGYTALYDRMSRNRASTR